jgi:hypothetical protein
LLGTLISIPQLIGAMNGAANSMAQQDVLQNLGINLGAVTIFGLLLRQELQARDKQIARLRREERLGSLWLKLSSGKNLQLAELRGSIRAVVLAGTEQQVRLLLPSALIIIDGNDATLLCSVMDLHQTRSCLGHTSARLPACLCTAPCP